MNFVVVYDACVLYPAPLRDLLLELAISELFMAKWSEQIHAEWIRNLAKNRPDLSDKLQHTKELMNAAVPDCLVEGYEPIVEGLSLPDKDDRHVLAAAIKSGAQIIVTFNLKDFPSEILDNFGIEAQHPDEFIEHQMGLNEAAVIACAKRIRLRLKNPEKSSIEYLDKLASLGLAVTANRFMDFKDVI